MIIIMITNIWVIARMIIIYKAVKKSYSDSIGRNLGLVPSRLEFESWLVSSTIKHRR